MDALPNLREFRINLDWGRWTEPGLLRLINPIVRQALDRGIKVSVPSKYITRSVPEDEEEIVDTSRQEDLICYWDAPSDSDREIFRTITNREAIRISDDADPLEVWWKLHNMPPGVQQHTDGHPEDSEFTLQRRDPVYRVWLNEHFEVWRWRRENRGLIDSLETMKDEIQAASGESLARRVKHYLPLLRLMHPAIGKN